MPSFRSLAGGSVLINSTGLDKLSGDLAGTIDDVLHKGAFDIEAAGKSIARRKNIIDTGALINSIHVKTQRQLFYVIGPTVHYAIYQEFGTRRFGARPFMRPALNKNRLPILNACKEAIERHGSII